MGKRNKFKTAMPNFSKWTNPDGSPGGEVSSKATVHPTAIIEQFATVLSGAEIGENVVVPRGAIIFAGMKITVDTVLVAGDIVTPHGVANFGKKDVSPQPRP